LKVYLNDELAIDTDFELVRDYDGSGEAEEISRRIRSRALEYAAALVAGEHEVAVRLLFPEAVRLLGGRQAAISIIKEDADMKLISMEVEAPEAPIRKGPSLVSLVPVRKTREAADGTRSSTASLLFAMSFNDGATWTLVEAGHLGARNFAAEPAPPTP
jgi:hypothetical protein